MAQNDSVVVGIDVAKDKVDACIRALALRQTFTSTVQGHRKLVRWLRKHRVNKAVMEASGGYERVWARVLREADIEVRRQAISSVVERGVEMLPFIQLFLRDQDPAIRAFAQAAIDSINNPH